MSKEISLGKTGLGQLGSGLGRHTKTIQGVADYVIFISLV